MKDTTDYGRQLGCREQKEKQEKNKNFTTTPKKGIVQSVGSPGEKAQTVETYTLEPHRTYSECPQRAGRPVFEERYWIAPRIFHYYISFASLHFICIITLHLHLKIMPRQHEMHDMSRFKCHALHLHFMK